MIAILVVAALLAGTRGINAPPTATARMTVSKMRMADLGSSASGYAYNQQGDIPVSYTLYTNHGSGRYYHAPTPVHYVVGSPAPVAPVVSETTSPHEPVLLAYRTARYGIASPYAMRQPYPRDGFINYGAGQLTKYAQPLESPKPTARAPHYTPSAFAPSEADENIGRRSDDKKAEDDNESDYDDDDDGEENSSEEEKDEGRAIKDHEKATDFTTTHPIDTPEHPRPNIDVSFQFGDGVEHSAAQNSAHGEKGDKGYYKLEKFDVGERGQHDKSKQQEHYDIEAGNKKGYSDAVGNYGRYDEATKGEKSNSYGRTSYHKKGQKTSGFHKVYHKDEYKKDTDFYDESHKKGYFDKHATADEHYNAAEGDFERGAHHKSGFDHGNSGKGGHYDKGRTQNRDQGYDKEKGENSFYDHYESYGSDGDTRLNKKHGYEKSNQRH